MNHPRVCSRRSSCSKGRGALPANSSRSAASVIEALGTSFTVRSPSCLSITRRPVVTGPRVPVVSRPDRARSIPLSSPDVRRAAMSITDGSASEGRMTVGDDSGAMVSIPLVSSSSLSELLPSCNAAASSRWAPSLSSPSVSPGRENGLTGAVTKPWLTINVAPRERLLGLT